MQGRCLRAHDLQLFSEVGGGRRRAVRGAGLGAAGGLGSRGGGGRGGGGGAGGGGGGGGGGRGGWGRGGLACSAGLAGVAGTSRRRERAVKMSRPVGLAGCPAHSPASLSAGLRGRRAARSTRLKMSRARQMTLMSASMRRL